MKRTRQQDKIEEDEQIKVFLSKKIPVRSVTKIAKSVSEENFYFTSGRSPIDSCELRVSEKCEKRRAAETYSGFIENLRNKTAPRVEEVNREILFKNVSVS